MEVKERFKNNLYYYLNKNGKTQVELATFLGIPTTTVNGWFSGAKFPRPDLLDNIARFLGVGVADLISENYSPNQQTVFIKNVKETLGKKRISVNELAVIMDKPLHIVLGWLDGKTFPNEEEIIQISKILEKSKTELFDTPVADEVIFMARSIQGLTDAQKSIIQNMIKELKR